ncbi:15725_t:CDS:1, partial [Acaulospora colombiana]
MDANPNPEIITTNSHISRLLALLPRLLDFFSWSMFVLLGQGSQSSGGYLKYPLMWQLSSASDRLLWEN